MPLVMFALERGPIHWSVAPIVVVLALLGASCVSSEDRAGSRPPVSTGGSHAGPADLPTGRIPDLAFAAEPSAGAEPSAASALLPPTAPTGTPYRVCPIDYRHVDWNAGPEEIVDAHRRASAVACAEQDWYRETAFQNGILSFMVLVGQATLAAAAPQSDEPAAMVDSLRRQGFDRVRAIDIAGSGRCEEGEVQAALLTLDPGPTVIDGLDSMVASAAANGADVSRRPSVTVISGAGAPCAAAIVHAGNVIGWVTAADRRRLDEAVAAMILPLRAEPSAAVSSLVL